METKTTKTKVPKNKKKAAAKKKVPKTTGEEPDPLLHKDGKTPPKTSRADTMAPRKATPADAREFIKPYEQEHADAFNAAIDAEKVTDTATWQHMYEDRVKEYDLILHQSTAAIRSACTSLEERGGASAEKAIKDTLKRLKESREWYEAWLEKTVRMVSGPVAKCTEVRERCLREARNAEQDAPLFKGDLAKLVMKELGGWAQATFDDKTGRVKTKN